MDKDCNNCKFEIYNPDEIPCRDCGMDDRKYWEPKPQTHADRIRATTDDRELAEILVHLPLCRDRRERSECERKGIQCSDCLYEWLTEPAEP